MAEEQQLEAMTDEQVLAYTQHKRKFFVSELMKNNQLPGDDKEKAMLLQALDGMDRAALGNKRIKADEKTADKMAGAAGLIASVLSQINTNTPGAVTIGEERAAPVLPGEIPDPILVPGELDTQVGQMDYESFMNKAGQTALPEHP